MKQVLKTTITFVILIYCVTPSWAQDIIVTNQSQKIEAKIIEVSKTEIRYKELDNIDGPTFVLGVEDIVSIIYANGKVVLYNQHAPEEANTLETSIRDSINSTKIEQKKPLDNSGYVGGISWSIAGREILSLPKPATDFGQEGKVVVQINVNAAGHVVSAMCTNGTTVSDLRTRQLALDAAYKAKFSVSKNKIQVGTITYTFKLN